MMGATQWGAFGMPLIGRKIGDFKFVQLAKKVDGLKPWVFFPIYMLGNVFGAQVSPISPNEIQLLCNDVARRPTTCCYKFVRNMEPIQIAAARFGFKQMNLSFLQKLMRELKCKFAHNERPTTEKATVVALFKFVLPTVTAEEIKMALDHRGSMNAHEVKKNSILSVRGNLAKIEHSMDREQHDIVKKAVDSVHGGGGGGGGGPRPAEGGDGGDGDEPRRPWALRPMPDSPSMSIQEARTFLPRVKGAKLSKDVKRFSRWMAEYPRTSPPYMVTKCWGSVTGLSHHQALVFVLERIWSWHTEETGEACPWRFE
jgi:hypothetical protein